MEAFIEEYLSPDKIFITVAVLATLSLFLVSVLAGVSIRRRARDELERCRYRPRKHLMVGAEKACFQLLNDLFGQRFYVIPGVALSSLLSHKVGLQDRRAAYNFIKDKTVDFVLCNQRTLRPVCAVKLEDEKSKKPDKTPGASPEDMAKFFKSARIPFVYLREPTKITRTRVIDEFSRVIYETSTMKPLPRGRRKKTASDTPATYKTRQKKSPDDLDATPKRKKSTRSTDTASASSVAETASPVAKIPTPATLKSTKSTKSTPKKSSAKSKAYDDYEDDISDEELEKYFE